PSQPESWFREQDLAQLSIARSSADAAFCRGQQLRGIDFARLCEAESRLENIFYALDRRTLLRRGASGRSRDWRPSMRDGSPFQRKFARGPEQNPAFFCAGGTASRQCHSRSRVNGSRVSRRFVAVIQKR